MTLFRRDLQGIFLGMKDIPVRDVSAFTMVRNLIIGSDSWPKQAQVSWINTNILSSQKFQSSNPTTLIFDKTQSSSIQKWLSTLRRVERGVSSSTSICCRPQDMNHVSLTPTRWIPGEILSFMKVLKWWNVCVCVCVCVWCVCGVCGCVRICVLVWRCIVSRSHQMT